LVDIGERKPEEEELSGSVTVDIGVVFLDSLRVDIGDGSLRVDIGDGCPGMEALLLDSV
jgi:hypothetical protein